MNFIENFAKNLIIELENRTKGDEKNFTYDLNKHEKNLFFKSQATSSIINEEKMYIDIEKFITEKELSGFREKLKTENSLLLSAYENYDNDMYEKDDSGEIYTNINKDDKNIKVIFIKDIINKFNFSLSSGYYEEPILSRVSSKDYGIESVVNYKYKLPKFVNKTSDLYILVHYLFTDGLKKSYKMKEDLFKRNNKPVFEMKQL
tara:strand:+ start:349 stop:960 length:612 start_codon:yes stop_codon:yes gene_type:complete